MNSEQSNTVNIVATITFIFAIIHTLSVRFFKRASKRFASGTIFEKIFLFLSEIELVFGVWAIFFILFLLFHGGRTPTLVFLQSLDFSEVVFVFAILVISSSRAILFFTNTLLWKIASLIPTNHNIALYFTIMSVGSLLGSVITEPAAMTVCAYLLSDLVFGKNVSKSLRYSTLSLLFVNISIGGTLTPFAAPPILIVAAKWKWDLKFMFFNFGVKSILAIFVSTLIICAIHSRELINLKPKRLFQQSKLPHWLIAGQLIFLALVIINVHNPAMFLGFLFLFLGYVQITKQYQSKLKIKEGLLVSIFLAGIVVLGSRQNWWLEPLIKNLSSATLYINSIILTAFVDNAALTYLGTQTLGITDVQKYFLVSGSVVGGGLTIIANAPNPVGYEILNPYFGKEGIHPLRLFLHALIPTIVSALCFWLL